MRIRTYLLLFTLAILTPMIAFSAIAVVAFDRQQRAAVERGGVDTARALVNAVDRELSGAITTLRALATAQSLERGDLAAFWQDARRVHASQRGWLTILLISPSGTLLADTSFPFGAALPPVRDRATLDEAVRTGGPVVGRVTYGPVLQRFAVPIRVPIVHDGAVRYVLTAVIDASVVDAVLRAQNIPAESVGTVFDSVDNVVARTRSPEEFVGRPISQEFRTLAGKRREGWGITRTLEGGPVYTAFSRSELTGWGVGLGIPTAVVDRPLHRSLWTIAAGGAAFLMLAVVGSLLVGRRLSRAIATLSTAAGTVSERDDGTAALAIPEGPAEVAAAVRAFEEARALLRKRAAERDEAERERVRLLARAEAARAEAEAANRAKDQFLAVLSHELRTPLNAVYGWSRLLRTGQRDPESIQRALAAIERNAAAQAQLVEDLLDVSRISTGKMRLELRPVGVAGIVTAALDSVRPAAQAKGVDLMARVDADLPPVMGDPDRLQQVVWNLVMNAIKFTPAGGRVDVSLGHRASSIEIEVRDTGVGIAPDLLPYLFERFWQADSTTTRAHGGLGLGLTLVRHLVELHGGTVRAASDGEGHGATFVVTLPALTAAAEAARSDRAARRDPSSLVAGAGSLDGVRVLAVDDAEDNLELVRTILAEAGATVAVCRSAAEALVTFPEFRPDAVVADIEMPDQDGYALVRAVRALARDDGGDTPAIAVTAYGGPENRQRALAAGFDVHLAKPIEADVLVSLVASLVRARSDTSAR